MADPQDIQKMQECMVRKSTLPPTVELDLARLAIIMTLDGTGGLTAFLAASQKVWELAQSCKTECEL